MSYFLSRCYYMMANEWPWIGSRSLCHSCWFLLINSFNMHGLFTEAEFRHLPSSAQLHVCCGELRSYWSSLSSILPPISSHLTEKSFWMSAACWCWQRFGGHCDSLWLFWSMPEHALLIPSQCGELSYIASGHVRLVTTGVGAALTARWDGETLKVAVGRGILWRRKGKMTTFSKCQVL